jgi:tetratricopeptide (TPR) repeat protein
VNCANKLLLVCLFLAVQCGQANTILEGSTAFAKGDFPAAIRAFEAALKAQGPSAQIYYNLAMAQQKEGQRASAAVSLRRAIMLDPRMLDARMALSEIERSQGVPAVAPTWREWVAERVPLHVLMVGGCTLIWLGAFLFLYYVFVRKGRLLRLSAAVGLLVIGAALFSIGYLADPRVSERHMAVVSEKDGVTLLAAPANQSATVVRLPGAAPVRILGRSGEWTFCSAPGGERGWAPSASLDGVVPVA